MKKVAVTGANGFVGSAAVSTLASRGFDVRRVIRRSTARNVYDTVAVGDVNGLTDWSEALADVDVLVHLVAHTHVTHPTANDSLALYRTINAIGTRRLAEQAAEAGVRRFVFLSSIKVNGERSLGRPFRAKDSPAPEDAYGISKSEAEEALAAIAASSGMEVVIVRPPLIYGPGVKGNFLRLMGLVAKGLPLPLGSVENRRSLVALDNLVDLLVRCVDAPQVRNRTLLVSDGEPLSTPDLIRSIAAAMDRPAQLLPVPIGLLRVLGRISGHANEIERLVGSLEVDGTETCELLNWRPPVFVHEAIRATVAHYLS